MSKAKALDGFLEKPTRDSGFDLLASRQLSREIDGVLRKHFEDKQRMSVATNYFAIACPIMPTFLLGAFMLLDKLDGMYDKGTIKAHDFVRQQQQNSQALYIAAMREKMEIENKKQGLACSRPIDGLPQTGTDKGKKPKKKSAEILMGGKPSERLNGPVLLSKEQREVKKIVKTKMAMEAHLEKLNQEQDFAGVCKVSAQIELDKALKKLGC
jgi:hypothetical protein